MTEGDKILRAPDVLNIVALSRTTLWRKVRNGSFPAPLQLGTNSIGWLESTINEWMKNLKHVNYAKEQK